jgi:hypothetical protein
VDTEAEAEAVRELQVETEQGRQEDRVVTDCLIQFQEVLYITLAAAVVASTMVMELLVQED